MGEVIAFPVHAARGADDEGSEIDLVTAVDVAIRDLRDIAAGLHVDETLRRQARDCLLMLSQALAAAQAR